MGNFLLFPFRLALAIVFTVLFIMREVGERGCDFIENKLLK